MARNKQEPFDIKESALQGDCDTYEKLTAWLCDALNDAIDVRGQVELELDYYWRLYEQQRTRLASHMPWPDAADLTSPLGTQYVDSFHARAMQTMFGVDKVWTVEGWGDSIPKAPFVESFHQWTFEDERGPSACDQAIFNAWVDGVGILEVAEAIDYRPTMKRGQWYQAEVDELTQAVVMGDDNQPKIAVNPDGRYIDSQPGQPGSIQADVDSYEPVRVGPEYDVIDYRDFYVLPRHARSRKDVWGYGKRFFRTVQYLREKVDDGVYARDFVDSIHDDNERETDLDDARRNIAVARQDGPIAQKELFEVAFLKNLDGKGLRWWIATVHLKERLLGRLKYDDLSTECGFGRYVRYIPFPRKNQVDRGLSLIEKIITLIEEHTALRNMRADCAAKAVAAPIKRLHTALWRPEEVPLGPKAVIDVRSMDEVQAMELPDVPASLNDWERTVLDGTERTIGMTDIASGVEPEHQRTLGERRMTTGFSQVRVDLPIKRLQESNEDLWQIRHAIWKRTLAQQGDGVDIPQRAMYGLEQRGVDIQPIEGGKFTADLLEGKFRGKPFGSVETADPQRQRADWNDFLGQLPALMQVNGMIAAMLQTPEAGRSMLERSLDVHGVKDKQPFLGMQGQSAMGTAGLIGNPQIQSALQMLQGGGAPGMLGADPAMGGGPGLPTGPAAPPMPDLGTVQ